MGRMVFSLLFNVLSLKRVLILLARMQKEVIQIRGLKAISRRVEGEGTKAEKEYVSVLQNQQFQPDTQVGISPDSPLHEPV